MSGVGRCYDNARMESFFATPKKEKLYQRDKNREIGVNQFEQILIKGGMING
ncbi:MAG: hypothetical protein PHI24_14045 [Desulfitobacteriaceae bacterium]|nr:hypothetical protein [Desulfitobacteriaceae bacterium]